MYKLITSDLDETLLRADGSISADNVAAIKAATKMGVKFVPNTGRNFLTVQPLLEQLGLKQRVNEYVISYNGGAVVENAGNQVIISNALTYDEARKVFATFLEFPNTSVHVYTIDQLYIYRLRDDDRRYMQTRGVTFTEMTTSNFEQFSDQPIMKVIAMNPAEEVRHQMYAAIERNLQGTVNITYSSGIYVEVNHGGVDKGKAVLDLASRLGIKADEIMALGDNSNDLAMLKAAGLAVSVANGIPEVKAVADYVTTADYENGVAEAIHKFVLD
ncbi:HAD superfamily hydrolase [Lentilactobacillus senioris DSM 24302 = JCM 17472]|uniref:HAD superfamily hydrolase n=1 Tax=Lentilactobacillus senioris DSM 24302 = JCM 17472 TaxID=1423802 RepID=A0A0R2D3C8_9LACO|nr:Cof-type HAD-IIB family hydrolase [Lentilactobacillus senioris]KRM94259.1 HAD superfamily hydrolase [Lentilactobacillus senioris DSM 24302 = JCM 17472]